MVQFDLTFFAPASRGSAGLSRSEDEHWSTRSSHWDRLTVAGRGADNRPTKAGRRPSSKSMEWWGDETILIGTADGLFRAPQHTSLASRAKEHTFTLRNVPGCAEINSSFHRPHSAATYAKWRRPRRSIFDSPSRCPARSTHDQKLRRARLPLERFWKRPPVWKTSGAAACAASTVARL